MSKEINEIYEKLLSVYRDEYPHNPKGVLSFHIDKVRKEGKSIEEAILILAVRKNISIPALMELVKKGKSQEEAISELSKEMTFTVTESRKVLVVDCPMCSGKMEKGYFRFLSDYWGWGWVEEKKPWTMGYCVKASKCRDCGIIIITPGDISESVRFWDSHRPSQQ
jgi:hypothetical protein